LLGLLAFSEGERLCARTPLSALDAERESEGERRNTEDARRSKNANSDRSILAGAYCNFNAAALTSLWLHTT
jgi:hypothetical protein